LLAGKAKQGRLTINHNNKQRGKKMNMNQCAHRRGDLYKEIKRLQVIAIALGALTLITTASTVSLIVWAESSIVMTRR
jgi:hypothetical protein